MTSLKVRPRTAGRPRGEKDVAGVAPPDEAEHGRDAEPDQDITSYLASRTRLSALITRTVGWACVVVAVGGGAVGLVSALGDASGPRPPQQVTVTGPVGAERSAGSFAAGYVGAWLEATQQDPGRLAQFVRTENLTLPKGATPYRDLVVSSISYDEPGDLVAVLIGASVRERSTEGAQRWRTRYFQVTLHAAGGLSVVGLPAPVAAPEPATEPAPLAYDRTVTSGSQLHQDITSFLAAYATGQGELDRYITPDSALRPIDPAPYEQVHVTAITSVGEVPPTAGTGAVAHVLVTARLGTQESGVPVTYAVSVLSRDGRWEVSTVDTRPKVSVTVTESEN